LLKAFDSPNTGTRKAFFLYVPTYRFCVYSQLELSPQENQGNVSFGYVPQGIVLGPTQAALPDPSAHRTPTLGQPAAENFQRLANRYVNHPDSQVVMVRMEPGSAGRYQVVIVLEMADFL